MGGAHLLKRIPRIKFPQRHPKLSDEFLLKSQGLKIGQTVLTNPTASKLYRGGMEFK
ncbi:hypothetical protein MKW94_012796 [Papaver nudicaule]|uniref:Uncharacterized protein n=1 Tax=Papaver nudicaule TaxID=74823 RepID=A0AA41SAN1_PAPNU|nr:hypothetical protein [Papaver nudicaule]